MKTLLLFAFIYCGGTEQSLNTSLDDTTTYYRCPPCGCAHDHSIMLAPGKCPSCPMPLIMMRRGWRRSVDKAVVPFLSDSQLSNLYYSKFIYPSIIIALVIGLAMLRKIVLGKGNAYLAIFIITLGLYGFKYQLTGVSYAWHNNLNLQFIPISFILLLGPSLYFYVRSAIERNFQFKRDMLWHFMPAAVFFLAYAVAYLNDTTRHLVLVTPFESGISHVEQILTVLGVFGYGYLSLKLIRGRKHLNGSWDYQKGNVRWLEILLFGLIGMATVWALMLTVNAMIYDWKVTTITNYPLWLIFAIYLYGISYYVIFKSQEFYVPGFAVVPKDTDRGLSAEQISGYAQKLKDLMVREKVFLDTGLSLQSLGDMIELNPKKLSVVLKKGMGTNFFDFVNSYRIEEVKKQLVNPENSHLTNIAIAYNAGFQSKSSFNAIFKRHVKLTPKEFKKEQERTSLQAS